MKKLRARLVISSGLLLAMTVMWRAASTPDMDSVSAWHDFVDDSVSASRMSSLRNRGARVESGHQPAQAEQSPIPLDDGPNEAGADGAAGGAAAPTASAGPFRRNDFLANEIANEKTDEGASNRLVQDLTAGLKAHELRGKLKGVRCGGSVCEATFDFADFSEAVRHVEAASQYKDGRVRQVDFRPASSLAREDIALRVYLEKDWPR